MAYNRALSLPFLFAAVFEGIAIATLYGYGPLYMRSALGQASLSVASLSIGLASFAGFVMASVWGRWGDRTGRTTSLIAIGAGIAAVSLFLLPSASGAGAFITLTILVSGGMAAAAPLGLTWLTMQEPETPGAAAARYYRARTIGWAIGSYGAGYVVQLMQIQGLSVVFRLAALGSLSAAVWLALLKHPRAKATIQDPTRTEETITAHSPAETRVIVWRQPLVLAVAASVLLVFGGNEAFFALMGPYFTEYLHGEASWVGVAVGTASLAGILVASYVGGLSDTRGPTFTFGCGALGYTVLFLLMSLLRYPLPTIILFALPLFPFMSTGVTGLMVRHLPAEQRGEAIGVYEGSIALAASLGSMLGGAVADVYGLGSAPVLAFALAATGAIVAWRGVLLRAR